MENRFQIEPATRISVFTGIASTYGFAHGLIKGSKNASIRYLAENAHRLPRSKGTWYFFHKRKNYVILKDGTNYGVKTALRFGSIAAAFVSLEAGIDQLRGKVDMLSTIGAAGIVGSGLTILKGLSKGQVFRSTIGFMLFGAFEGGVQDLIRRKRSRDGLNSSDSSSKSSNNLLKAS